MASAARWSRLQRHGWWAQGEGARFAASFCGIPEGALWVGRQASAVGRGVRGLGLREGEPSGANVHARGHVTAQESDQRVVLGMSGGAEGRDWLAGWGRYERMGRLGWVS
jgi:hypothetical protein